MEQKKIFQKGFTLVELILYLGIFSFFTISFTQVGIDLFQNHSKISAIEEVQNEARFIMNQIGFHVQNAQSITFPTIGLSDDELILTSDDLLLNPIIFDLSANALRIKKASSSAVSLSSNSIVVSSLQFRNVSALNTPGTISVSFVISALNPSNKPEFDYSKNYSATFSIYEDQNP